MAVTGTKWLELLTNLWFLDENVLKDWVLLPLDLPPFHVFFFGPLLLSTLSLLDHKKTKTHKITFLPSWLHTVSTHAYAGTSSTSPRSTWRRRTSVTGFTSWPLVHLRTSSSTSTSTTMMAKRAKATTSKSFSSREVFGSVRPWSRILFLL